MLDAVFSADGEFQDPLWIITCRGEIDVFTAPSLRDAIAEALSEDRSLIAVDLTEVDFCDSQGINALVFGRKLALEQGGELWLVMSEHHRLKRLLEITGLLDFFPISATIDGCV